MATDKVKRYNAIKALPPEVIAAFVEVEVISRLHIAVNRINRLRLTENWLEWRKAIESELVSALESWDELADYPAHYRERFDKDWQQHFAEE